MNIEVKDKLPSTYELQVGDIVEECREGKANIFYIVASEYAVKEKQYVMRSLEDSTGDIGFYNTLDELTFILQEFYDYIIYPKSKYKLVIERK